VGALVGIPARPGASCRYGLLLSYRLGEERRWRWSGCSTRNSEQVRSGQKVLDRLGDLTGDVGDLSGGARKAHLKESRPHTDAELGWIEEVIQALIRRAGEYAADSNAQRTRLTMDDFPAL
jgi:hypothetical protein